MTEPEGFLQALANNKFFIYVKLIKRGYFES